MGPRAEAPWVSQAYLTPPLAGALLVLAQQVEDQQGEAQQAEVPLAEALLAETQQARAASPVWSEGAPNRRRHVHAGRGGAGGALQHRQIQQKLLPSTSFNVSPRGLTLACLRYQSKL